MSIRKKHCVLQNDASDCAAAVVSTILLTYRQEVSIAKIREVIGTDAYGTTVKGIVTGLEKFHFSVKALRTTSEELSPDLTYPAIAQIRTREGLNHFVVIHKVTKSNKIILADPSIGIQKYDRESFNNLFTGVIIFMVPTSDFEVGGSKEKGLFNLFASLILKQKKMLAVIIMASALMMTLGIFVSFFSKVIMDEIIPYGLKDSLYVFLLIFGFITIVQNLIGAFREHILLFLSRKIDIPILLGYYNHIIRLPYSFFGTRKIGDVITRFQDAMTIKDIFTSVTLSLGLDISLALFSSIILWNLNPTLFYILLVIIFINIVLIYFFKKPYRKLNYEQMEAGAMLNAQLIDSIRNIETVKSHNDEHEQMQKLENRFVNSLKISYREGVLQNIQSFVSSTINALGGIILLGIGASFIIDGQMSIGDLLVFQSLSQFFISPVQNLVSLQITFQEAQVAMKRLNELMSIDREDLNKEEKIMDVSLKGDIVFKDISFAYGSRPPVIKNLNITIPKGKKVAFVGESGAGKSTIARLLMKFVQPNNGDITISGYSINDIDSYYLRKKISYIPQNIELFTGTIIDNLKVGYPNATYEEIINTCKLSGASTFIEKLQNRYNSYIEEGGGNFSGGEKQRLAIARALLTKSDFFIFDEATSNLDSFSEQKIQNIIFEKIKGKTTIIIAHRLSTILQCDRIYFVENGEVVEEGTHEELLALNGKYADLVQTQLSFAGTSTKRESALLHDETEEITYE